MGLSYRVESWADYWPEAEKLWPVHHAEVALDQEMIPLDVDKERYEALDAAGHLHIVTARDDEGRLQGYHLSVVSNHLHYRTTLHAVLDVFWLHPAHRRGLAGYRLFRVVRDTLRARGVVKHVQGCKRHLDVSPLFARLGYTEIERVWSTVL